MRYPDLRENSVMLDKTVSFNEVVAMMLISFYKLRNSKGRKVFSIGNLRASDFSLF